MAKEMPLTAREALAIALHRAWPSRRPSEETQRLFAATILTALPPGWRFVEGDLDAERARTRALREALGRLVAWAEARAERIGEPGSEELVEARRVLAETAEVAETGSPVR